MMSRVLRALTNPQLALAWARAAVRRSLSDGRSGNARMWQSASENDKMKQIFEAINYLRVAGLPATFFEFGCYSGRTFSAALLSAHQVGLSLDAYAFDSFQGLPGGEGAYFKKGMYQMGRARFREIVKESTAVLIPDANIIEGFFEDSLTDELAARLPVAGLIHIDVDLFTSTSEVLEFAQQFWVPGSVVLMDDWYAFAVGQPIGARLAWEEFFAKHPEVEIEEWKPYSTFGKAFFITKSPASSSLIGLR